MQLTSSTVSQSLPLLADLSKTNVLDLTNSQIPSCNATTTLRPSDCQGAEIDAGFTHDACQPHTQPYALLDAFAVIQTTFS
jgi:hypothetical protein